MSSRADTLTTAGLDPQDGARGPHGTPRNPAEAGLPDGRLKKRLRAAWRWRQVAGLLSLLWPFFQRFSLAETPEGNFPERPMSTKLGPGLAQLRGTRSSHAEEGAEPTCALSRLRVLFL